MPGCWGGGDPETRPVPPYDNHTCRGCNTCPCHENATEATEEETP